MSWVKIVQDRLYSICYWLEGIKRHLYFYERTMYSLSMVNKNNPYYIFIIELMISRSMSIPQKDSCIEHSRTLIKVSSKARINLAVLIELFILKSNYNELVTFRLNSLRFVQFNSKQNWLKLAEIKPQRTQRINQTRSTLNLPCNIDIKIKSKTFKAGMNKSLLNSPII